MCFHVIQSKSQSAALNIWPKSSSDRAGKKMSGKIMGKSVFRWDLPCNRWRTLSCSILWKCIQTKYAGKHHRWSIDHQRTLWPLWWRNGGEFDVGHPLSIRTAHYQFWRTAVEWQNIVPVSPPLLWIWVCPRRGSVSWLCQGSEWKNR